MLRRALAATVAALAAVCACSPVQMATMWYHLTGGETIEAKHKLKSSALAVILDDPQGLITIPAVHRHFHQSLQEQFVANRIEAKLVAFEEMERLRSKEDGFDDLSVRAIGEKVGADQVLYLRVTDFALTREPGAPIFEGRFAVRASLCTTERKRDVRLWPREQDGESAAVITEPAPSDAELAGADVARELAVKLADKVAQFFYDHKEKR